MLMGSEGWHQIQARNIIGGPWSTATDPIKPDWNKDQLVTSSAMVLLQPPTELTTSYVGRVLHLSWESSSEGLLARVAYKKHTEGFWKILPGANYTRHNSAVVEGLDLAEYDFSVSEVNELGGGPWSSPVSALVGAQHPDPPSQPMQTTEASRLDRITVGNYDDDSLYTSCHECRL